VRKSASNIVIKNNKVVSINCFELQYWFTMSTNLIVGVRDSTASHNQLASRRNPEDTSETCDARTIDSALSLSIRMGVIAREADIVPRILCYIQ
jgi:hypothetical protein